MRTKRSKSPADQKIKHLVKAKKKLIQKGKPTGRVLRRLSIALEEVQLEVSNEAK